MNKELLRKYKNGNYTVFLYTDGTKEKITEEDDFKAEFPDSIDLKITNYCDANCPMCHENSGTHGLHADLNAKFLTTLPSGIELAIGGGNPLSHPDLIPFLTQMKNQGIICNITVNEKHLISDNALIARLIEENLVWGVGVSINEASPQAVKFLKSYSNSVAHLICGMVTPAVLSKLRGIKILLLGFKQKGRGENYYNEGVKKRIEGLKLLLPHLFNCFESISFDNLALNQTQICNHLPQSEFDKRFMGNDGEGSMYIDLVNKKYAVSSTAIDTYDIKEDIKQMFSHVNAMSVKS